MKTLYMIRHAKSSWEFDVLDDKRPLNQRGLKDADLVGEALKTVIKPIDLVLCSPAERAHTTAKIVLSHLDLSNDTLILESDLYDFDGRQVIEVIKNCKDSVDTLMIFGHNHAFTSIANLFGSEVIDNLPTTGVVGIEFDIDTWKNVNVGKTVLIITPKSLK